MKRYLLCTLDDENYAEPKFYAHESREKAFKNAVEDCINAADGGDFQMEVENNQNRISVNFDYDNFFVTEIKELDLDDGNYAIIWHHAYEGVGFEVLFQGTYRICVEKRKELIKKAFEENDYSGGDNTDFDMENDTCIDTGIEWEMYSIVNLLNGGQYRFKYILWYDGGLLRDSSAFGWGVYDTYEEAHNAIDKIMDYWEMEDEEYDPRLFEIEIEKV